jgi:2'-5' RNA ligase
MNTVRTFVAVEMSPAVIRRAQDLIQRLQVDDVKVKWVDPANMHVTLKFLGDVPESEVSKICEAVARAAAAEQPFEVSLAGAGAFPDLRCPRTVWIGVDQGSEALCRLQASVDSSLKKLGFPKERRGFHPHLTIGRVRQVGPAARALGDRIREQEQFAAGQARIERAVVFASYLDRGGPTYEMLGQGPLGLAM